MRGGDVGHFKADFLCAFAVQGGQMQAGLALEEALPREAQHRLAGLHLLGQAEGAAIEGRRCRGIGHVADHPGELHGGACPTWRAWSMTRRGGVTEVVNHPLNKARP
jgi:hypothetical protein